MTELQHELHRCGRRDDTMHWMAAQRGQSIDTSTLPKEDTWHVRVRTDHPGTMGDGQRSCSYCGSMHPDDLFAAIESGVAELGPTDKNYKMYVNGVILEHPTHPQRWHHKFYFQHFTDEQQTRFIEMLNAGKLRISYPGHFYSLPFFIRRG